ncbi:ribonuclease H2 subunit A, putative [Entamoeba invadens IP1]|uniref:Ribonuclease n=1 Tax=Entamoeba invadens IP1 TaxID=370355 RepID=A0A0A1UAL2_ENTIV|nr:ribonuclease H2 subunit A, putative [Entamoeba invadens IP1]ELP92087.1 ribonuclease H2 subunit A, putative [Entamoeba invadens IP1]|eukprot:XP_004258858.1 ribonuclease H2 subunit A, putative [Entamoeba invadens IP1]
MAKDLDQIPTFKAVDTDGEITIGIDEAGRGPVVGPMVYTAFFTTDADEVSDMGFKDSKVLNKAQRESLYSDIHNSPFCGYSSEVLTPSDINKKMCQPLKISLNEVAFSAVRTIISRILNITQRGVKGVFVDTVGPPAKYKAMIAHSFPQIDPECITVCSKADAKYPVVSGASIVAKVTRDVCLERWIFKETHTEGFSGFGYPTDLVTINWMKESYDPVFGYPNFVRFGWETSKRIVEKKYPIHTPVHYKESGVCLGRIRSKYLAKKCIGDVPVW